MLGCCFLLFCVLLNFFSLILNNFKKVLCGKMLIRSCTRLETKLWINSRNLTAAGVIYDSEELRCTLLYSDSGNLLNEKMCSGSYLETNNESEQSESSLDYTKVVKKSIPHIFFSQ